MAFTTTLSQICILLTTVYSVAYSQVPPGTDPGLFANLLSSSGPTQPATNDLTSMLGAAPVGGAPTTGFGPSPMGSLPPSPSFPTFGAGGSSPSYLPSQAAPAQDNNPMRQLMPYFLYRSGNDMMQMLGMMSFLRGGSSGMGGGLGGLMGSPFFMLNMLNNM